MGGRNPDGNHNECAISDFSKLVRGNRAHGIPPEPLYLFDLVEKITYSQKQRICHPVAVFIRREQAFFLGI